MAERNQRNQNQNRFDPLAADGAPVLRNENAGRGRRGGRGGNRQETCKLVKTQKSNFTFY